MRPLCTSCNGRNLTEEIKKDRTGYRCGDCNSWICKLEADNFHIPFKNKCTKCSSSNLGLTDVYECNDCGNVDTVRDSDRFSHKSWDIKKGNRCLILDEGMKDRGVEGEVLHNFGNGNIVVKFTPWGYKGVEWTATLVFSQTEEVGVYRVLDPGSTTNRKIFADSKFCELIKWW